MAMEKKTQTQKTQAQKFIENRAAEMRNSCEEEISRMTEEVKVEEQKETNRKTAAGLYDIYQSYIEAGFSKEEAWELVKILMSNGTRRTLF